MNNIEIVFEHPWLLLLSVPALAIILVPFFLLPVKRRKTIKKSVPVVLHSVMVAMLVLILSGFSIIHHSQNYSTMVLVDLSDSTVNIQEDIMEYAREILDIVNKNESIGILAFGDDCVYVLELDSQKREFQEAMVVSDATNIGEALEYAVSQMPDDKAKRIILLSDGKETDGDANHTAQYLATQDVRIDVIYFDTTMLKTDEMQLSSLIAPEGAYVGDEIVITAEIGSNYDGAGTLTLYDNETAIAYKDLPVTVGKNLVEFTIVLTESGIHTYRMELSAQSDTLEQNNEIYACLKVEGMPTVLIIADRTANASAMEEILKDENEVTVVSVFNAPKTITELCNYDEVILMNVDANTLPNGYDELLEDYVSMYGRSLLAIGGDDTYMYGNMEGTQFEEMFPVAFSLSETNEGNNVALMLVLDCSESMCRLTTYQSVESTYLSVAKQGAIKCVEALNANNYVGVVSFNSTARVVSPLTQATESNKKSVTRTISPLTESKGTCYTEALEMAYEELQASTAESKCVIFLSDGEPSDLGYDAAVSKMSAAGITVSTIGLGYSSRHLSNMAEIGNGHYYYVSNVSDLPDIMLSETEQITTVSSLITKTVTPIIPTDSDLTVGYENVTLPKLNGYLGTTIKKDATAYITTDKDHPIYAGWQYGTGHVWCFTSDLQDEWSSDWLNSQIGQTLIRRMVETTISDVHQESTFTTKVNVRGKSTDISIKTTGENEDDTVTVALTYGTESKTYTLFQREPGIFVGSLPTEKAGVYELVITQSDSKGELIDYENTAVAVSYSGEYDAFMKSGEGFLRNLCSFSDGVLTEDVQNLMSLDVASVTFLYNPLVLFGVLIAIILLADIAVRKIRWKDIKNYWYMFMKELKGGKEK